MKKEYIEEENNKIKLKMDGLYEKSIKELSILEQIQNEDIKRIVIALKKAFENQDEYIFDINQDLLKTYKDLDYEELNDIDLTLKNAIEYLHLNSLINHNLDLSDSDNIYFEGDILITDPCYICKETVATGEYPSRNDYFSYKEEEDYPDYKKVPLESLDELERRLVEIELSDGCKSEMYQKEHEEYDKAIQKYRDDNISDWELSNGGRDFEQFGFTAYMSRDTLYGDWSCTVFDTDTKKPIGEFCADSGMVGVFLLDEVLKYNPDVMEKLSSWAATVIKNFKGYVQMQVVHMEGIYEEDSEYHKKGEKWEDNSVEVVGTGNINFRTKQTGF